jgi:ApaG protein
MALVRVASPPEAVHEVFMLAATTEGIRVSVKPAFWPERSEPVRGLFAFTYTITIENVGELPAKLLRRHWIITDGTGKVEEVEGPGVVGQQPFLPPGEKFEYTSWVPLSTPIGTMKGSFFMVRPDGGAFLAEVPDFVLAQPGSLH